MAKATDLLMQRAVEHQTAGRLADAEAIYRQVLAQEPNHPSATHNLGLVLQFSGNVEEGIRLMRRSIELNRQSPHFRQNLAVGYRTTGRLQEALEVLKEAIARFPYEGILRQEMGLVLDKQGRYEDAVAEYRRALNLSQPRGSALTPQLAMTVARMQVNLGSALSKLEKVEEAVAAAQEAIKLRPDYPLAHMNLADGLFKLGRLQEAWPEYEWRWRRPNFTEKWPNYPQPMWDGSLLNGRTLLLWHEQGLGDTIQFCRYAPLAAQRGGKVIVYCQPELQRLLSTLDHSVEVLASGGSLPRFDVHLPLMSLPRIFNTSLQTIPFTRGYLKPDPQTVGQWSARMASLDSDAAGTRPLRVGLAWAGSPTQANDHNRSFVFSVLEPLMRVRGVRFISLQKGYAAAQLQQSPMRDQVIDWTAELNDYADTAALIAAMDLVITVDTSITHAAGALGAPVWTMLTYEPDFRYICDKDQSSWYASMRLFRQTTQGDWAAVIERVAGALRDRVSQRTASEH